MGESLPAVDLGIGRSAVAVSAGFYHTCVVLVTGRGEGSGRMMVRRKGRLGLNTIPHTYHCGTSTMRDTSSVPCVRRNVDRSAVFATWEAVGLPHAWGVFQMSIFLWTEYLPASTC